MTYDKGYFNLLQTPGKKIVIVNLKTRKEINPLREFLGDEQNKVWDVWPKQILLADSEIDAYYIWLFYLDTI